MTMTMHIGWKRLVVATAVIWCAAVGVFTSYQLYELLSKAEYNVEYEGRPMPRVFVSKGEVKALTEKELNEKIFTTLFPYRDVAIVKPDSIDSMYRDYVRKNLGRLLGFFVLLAAGPALAFAAIVRLVFWVLSGFHQARTSDQ